jgi:formiminoglutamase
MPQLTRRSIPVPDASEDDLRVGHLLGTIDAIDTAAAVIVGFPSDAGVTLNGGRAGAAGGPAALRNWLYRFTPDAVDSSRFKELLKRTVDVGDVALTGNVELDQEALGEVVAPILKDGAVPIILGGGHETAFGHFLGHVYRGQSVSVLNWDAHPDVRPLKDGSPHSGSPFRQMMLHVSGSCIGYTVAGLLPHQVSRAHVDWILDRGGLVKWRSGLSESVVSELYRFLEYPAMVSFDLDAVDQASAPGVSAPATGGLDVDTWLKAAYEAGRNPAVSSMDVVELNPRLDVDERTARLAALTVWTFLRGLSEREMTGNHAD